MTAFRSRGAQTVSRVPCASTASGRGSPLLEAGDRLFQGLPSVVVLRLHVPLDDQAPKHHLERDSPRRDV
jgi:hypothetical protein